MTALAVRGPEHPVVQTPPPARPADDVTFDAVLAAAQRAAGTAEEDAAEGSDVADPRVVADGRATPTEFGARLVEAAGPPDVVGAAVVEAAPVVPEVDEDTVSPAAGSSGTPGEVIPVTPIDPATAPPTDPVASAAVPGDGSHHPVTTAAGQGAVGHEATTPAGAEVAAAARPGGPDSTTAAANQGSVTPAVPVNGTVGEAAHPATGATGANGTAAVSASARGAPASAGPADATAPAPTAATPTAPVATPAISSPTTPGPAIADAAAGVAAPAPAVPTPTGVASPAPATPGATGAVSLADRPGAHLAGQLAGRVAALRALGAGRHVLTVAVDPEDLGPVRLVARFGADGVRVDLLGATEVAREALRAALPELRRDLAATGLQADLGLGDPRDQDPDGHPPGNTAPHGDADGTGGSAGSTARASRLVGPRWPAGPGPLPGAATGHLDLLA